LTRASIYLHKKEVVVRDGLPGHKRVHARLQRLLPGNDGCVSPRHMRRYREPLCVLLRPAISVSPLRLLPVRRGVAGCSVDDGEVAHDADLHVMGLQVLDRDWFRGLLKEGGAIDQRFVGI
jgi:hypothetical protein